MNSSCKKKLHTKEQTVYLEPFLIRFGAIEKLSIFPKSLGFPIFPKSWAVTLAFTYAAQTYCEKIRKSNQMLLRKIMCARTDEWVDISEIEGLLIGKRYQYISPKIPKRQQEEGSLTKFNIFIEKK